MADNTSASTDASTDASTEAANDASTEEAAPATVLGWIVPRPTGRWHQAIVVTSADVWITSEMPFAENQTMEAAAEAGTKAFTKFVRDAGWLDGQTCSVLDVKGLNWDNITGWMRILADGDLVIGAMIPNRADGDKIEPKVKKAIAAARAKAKAQDSESK